MSPLLSWMKKQNDKGEETLEVDLPKDTKEKLDKALSVGADVEEIKKQIGSLGGITAYIEEQKKEKEAAARAAAQRTHTETQTQTEEEISQLMITDPQKAINLGTKDQQMAILMLRADNIKKDVFEDAERFPYYIGETKTEIDKLISAQNLQARNDPSVIENCYFTVLGKKSEQIREGKLKNRFAGSGSSRGTASGAAGASSAAEAESPKLEINDDMRHAARIAGMTPEDYAKMCYEQVAGYV